MGAWRIGGGANGGFLAFLSGIAIGTAGVALLIAVFAAYSSHLLFFGATFFLAWMLAAILLVVIAYNYAVFDSEIESKCLDAGVMLGVTLITLVGAAFEALRAFLLTFAVAFTTAQITRSDEIPMECRP